MKQSKTPYPLRLDPEVEAAARLLAEQADRSLNWMLNSLVKQALAQVAREDATQAGAA